MSGSSEQPVPFRCRLGFHPWGRWSEPRPALVYFTAMWLRDVVRERVMAQSRTCTGCGKHEDRTTP